MKIDLHCHTKKIKTGEPLTRNAPPELFRAKLLDADIRIVAITNHNDFDITHYENYRNEVKDFCQVWPGIELECIGRPDTWHLVLVCNPVQVAIFNQITTTIFDGKQKESALFTIDDVVAAFNDLNLFYIPHYHKRPSISEDDLENLIELVGDVDKIIREPSSRSTLEVLSNHGKHVLIGSDVRDWNKYEECKFSELRLPVSSFEQLDLLIRKDPVVVNSLLNQKTQYTPSVSPADGIHFNLPIYNDINIIFGQKGTGKSKILQSMSDDMGKKGLKCLSYSGSEKAVKFDELLHLEESSRDISKIGADSCEREFKEILEWKENSLTLFSDYIIWMNTKNNSNNKKKLSITNCTTLSQNDRAELSVLNLQYKTIEETKRWLSSISVDTYIGAQKSLELETLISKLARAIRERQVDEYINIKAIELTNISIDKFKAIADKNSNTKSKPSTTGFRDFATNRIKLYCNCQRIINNISLPSKVEHFELGEVEGKGKILAQYTFSMLNRDSRAIEFKGRFRERKQIVQHITKLKSKAWSADVVSLHKDLLHDNFQLYTTTQDFLGISITTVTNDGKEYKPSEGEKGIILLQRVLDTQADAYFIDEPELGMGNSYIESHVRPKLSDLAKSHKIVVVATHNANIAVRTLPYVSIFRSHRNGEYKTYVGNPFVDELINIEADSDRLIWRDESLHTLEGGEEAFYGRSKIYTK